ncbi:Protein CCC1 [Ceratobasidium theobromae]|uniref:Protein CCC1 n=1 Tax=Ceratobasidium theobromae TaxID=1582974 RepID=A0A5N5QN37_9AGAM|nr:Protein CCC1 [Ceratobasidium theobromae]
MTCCKDSNSPSCQCASSSSSPSARRVPLPKRQRSNDQLATKKPPIWPIHSSSNITAPLPSKCDRNSEGREGVCCKELKGDDERNLIDPDIVRDVIIGLSDGLTVPFALTAGLSSIGSSRLVVIGGVAELIAGAISMGVGGFLASQAERDHFRYLRRTTRDRVLRSCSGEMEREVHAVLGPIGVSEQMSRALATELRQVEVDVSASSSATANGHGSTVTKRQSWMSLSTWGRKATVPEQVAEEEAQPLRWQDDVGLTAFLLKFGEGMEEVPTARLYTSAFTIGVGYLVGGLVPLLPYFFVESARVGLLYSCIVTGITLLVFGAVKTHYTGATGGAGGYIWGAVSTLLVGGFAAGAAFGIVHALEASE